MLLSPPEVFTVWIHINQALKFFTRFAIITKTQVA
jgi:hypothetical protein